MGDVLYISIRKEQADVQEAYCWPLIFEAMHRASFQFYKPGGLPKRGIYFSFLQAMDQVECTFPDLWNIIYQKKDEILVFYWFVHPSGLFHIEVSVKEREQGVWYLDLTIEDGFVGVKDTHQQTVRLNAFLQAGLALYELCVPCSMSMYWDEEGTNLMHVRPTAQEDSLEPIDFHGHILHWEKLAEVNDQSIYIANPVPLHMWGIIYLFVPLQLLN